MILFGFPMRKPVRRQKAFFEKLLTSGIGLVSFPRAKRVGSPQQGSCRRSEVQSGGIQKKRSNGDERRDREGKYICANLEISFGSTIKEVM
jgi:hypothetical protein